MVSLLLNKVYLPTEFNTDPTRLLKEKISSVYNIDLSLYESKSFN